jgi:hypothetical protein
MLKIWKCFVHLTTRSTFCSSAAFGCSELNVQSVAATLVPSLLQLTQADAKNLEMLSAPNNMLNFLLMHHIWTLHAQRSMRCCNPRSIVNLLHPSPHGPF